VSILLQGAEIDSTSSRKFALRRADSIQAVVQLKSILTEMMSINSQEGTSESDCENSLEPLEEEQEVFNVSLHYLCAMFWPEYVDNLCSLPADTALKIFNFLLRQISTLKA
jgi:hypothetical protein